MGNSEHQKIEDLEHLAKLKQDGILNEHEFEIEKARILSGETTLSEIQQEESSTNPVPDFDSASIKNEKIVGSSQPIPKPITRKQIIKRPLQLIIWTISIGTIIWLFFSINDKHHVSETSINADSLQRIKDSEQFVQDSINKRMQAIRDSIDQRKNTFTPSELLSQYDNNVAAADLKFKNRNFWVTGKISTIGKYDDDYYVQLPANGFLNSVFDLGVRCFFADPSVTARLSDGMTITIHGMCQGKPIGDVVMKDCIIAKSQPPLLSK